MTLKEILEKRAEAHKEIRRLADLNADTDHEWSAQDEEAWTRANEDYDRLSRQAERLQRAEDIEGDLERPFGRFPGEGRGAEDGREASRRDDRRGREDRGNRSEIATARDHAMALQAWGMAKRGGLTEDHLEACRKVGINPQSETIDVRMLDSEGLGVMVESRAQSTSAGAGGETIPAGFVPQWEMALLAFGGVRSVAEVIRTASGNQLTWPYTNDTGNKGALLAENAADSEQDITTGGLTLDAYKYTSKIVRVSVELLQDSAFDFASQLGRMLGERIARITAEHFTTGTGTSQPNGIVTAATVGKTAAANNAITADETLELFHAIDPAYRANAGFMCHDDIILAVRKLKDSNGQYIWQPGMQAGEPDRLWGRPVTINQDMAGFGSQNKVLLAGDFSYYKIRDVLTVTLKRLVERYAEYHQEGFVAISRHDADLLDAGTNPVQVLQLAV